MSAPNAEFQSSGKPVARAMYQVSTVDGTPLNGTAVGSALVAYPSNPAQTAAAGADTLYKFGGDGKSAFNHLVIQNNTAANVTYAFDQDSTASGNAIYVLAAGNLVFWDRAGKVPHFSSAAQQNFGGQSGITVEAFA